MSKTKPMEELTREEAFLEETPISDSGISNFHVQDPIIECDKSPRLEFNQRQSLESYINPPLELYKNQDLSSTSSPNMVLLESTKDYSLSSSSNNCSENTKINHNNNYCSNDNDENNRNKNNHSSNDTARSFNPAESHANSESNLHPKKTSTVPSPLNLPKRFKKNQLDQNSIQMLEPLQSLQNAMHQLFYNPSTGQIIALPVRNSMATPVQSSVVNGTPCHQQLLPTVSNRQQSMIPQYQIVYMRAANGQLVPLLAPIAGQQVQRQTPGTSCMKRSSSSDANDSPTSFSSQHASNLYKRMKPEESQPCMQTQRNSTAISSNSNVLARLSPTQRAEQIQRQQIWLQMQLHPDLIKGQGNTNVSDIYENNLPNGKVSSTSADETHDEVPVPSGNNRETLSSSSGNNQLNTSAQSLDTQTLPLDTELLVDSQKVIGTVTVGSFTYKYSQTLSGNIVKDRELFDRLTDNAWKTCISKH